MSPDDVAVSPGQFDGPANRTRFRRAVVAAIPTVSFLFIGLYLIAAFGRIGYPFELEWMEGAVVDHVRNILAGGVLYPPPNLTFVPFSYHPLYFLVSAAVATVTGVGFLPLRLVSFTASLACFALVYATAAKETGRREYGIAAVGLLAATYQLSGRWFDLARVDSLFVALILACAYCVRFGRGSWSAIVAAAFVALAFFTKQTASFTAILLALYLLLTVRKRGIVFTAALAVFVACGMALLFWQNGDWYLFYAFRLPAQHSISGASFYNFWIVDILASLPFSAAIVGVYLFGPRREPATRFYSWLCGAMLLGAWLTRLHTGGWLNCLMPAHAFYAMATPIAVHSIGTRLDNGTMRLFGLGRHQLGLLFLLQFIGLAYNPLAAIPTKQDEAAGRRLVSMISAIPGDVYVLSHGHIGPLAGKSPHTHQLAYYDILRGTERRAIGEMEGEMSVAIRDRRFSAIIVDDIDREPTPLGRNLEKYYSRTVRIFGDPQVFWPPSGVRFRPEFIYYPKR